MKIKIIIGLLILLNLFLIYSFVCESKDKKVYAQTVVRMQGDDAINKIYRLKREQQILALNKVIMDTIRVSIADQSFVLSDYLNKIVIENALCIYLSDNLCEACYLSEIDFMIDQINKGRVRREIVFITSQRSLNSIKSYLYGKIEHYRVVSLMNEQKLNQDMLYLDTPLFLTYANGQLSHMFVTDKTDKAYSECYYDYISHETN